MHYALRKRNENLSFKSEDTDNTKFSSVALYLVRAIAEEIELQNRVALLLNLETDAS